ncbi:cell division protein FtsZ [Lacibacterium aquatile]|uniref:Cell division protein FtsZ n=1 Tax=Lacibacterium aquatile TaxID=1168082 RepID=A0ABW5DVU1_9PROT
MSLSISVPNAADPELRPRITVIGVGGAGGNAVNNMIRSNLHGVDFVVTNTDAQALSHNLSSKRIQLGSQLTRGLGAGAKPEVGRDAAEEALEDILEQITGSNMVFIAAGMGGGTGTGAAPVIARAARERGILTVGVVTKPFHFEGANRMRLAENGILDLQQYVDTLIVIPNQNLFRLANERTTFADAFRLADDVLHAGVRGVTDLMMMPGLVNLDFADIRTVMSEMGKAMMGTGEATGDRRALDAAEAAISNPLLDDTSMKGARGVLINITGGLDMTLFEVDEAANRIRDEVDPEAQIIFGSTFDESMDGRIRVSVVATGIDAESMAEPRKPQISLVTDRGQPAFVPSAPAAPSSAPTAGGSYTAAPLSAGYGPATSVGAPLMTAAPAAPSMSTASAPSMSSAPVMSSTQVAERGTYMTHGNAALAEPVVMAQPITTPVTAPAAKTETVRAPMPSVEDAFMAPKPIEAASQPQIATPTAPRSAMPSAPAAAPKVDQAAPGGLFARFTNPFGRDQGAAPAVKTEPEMNVPTMTAPAAETAAPAAVRMTVASEGNRDESDLDIPAFLRRQAN